MGESSVDVHVERLRAKIEPDPGAPRSLVTVRGWATSSSRGPYRPDTTEGGTPCGVPPSRRTARVAGQWPAADWEAESLGVTADSEAVAEGLAPWPLCGLPLPEALPEGVAPGAPLPAEAEGISVGPHLSK
ncbi:hypothetical protein S1361_18415 [Streptomyces cyanogenus]|uniref:OmpR/PhoB-type domain-containing protein n=1 Tax=Streptomyces cyanogenus TaxID=80860 RepID=A0ABX7TV59_STRCY|nr:hypothetical protein S1361_18415 [Streptomyces cyanogenus]